MNQKHFDIMVVGGGPGGYVAAIRAAQLGFKVALVERDKLGGVCLNWGCIPTKALLHGAEMAHTLKQAEQYGFSFDNLQLDIGKLVGHSRSVANQLSQGIEYLMKKNAISVIEGSAELTAKCQLTVHSDGIETVYQADHIILATGARPKQLPLLPLDDERVWNAQRAMTPDALPKHLVVVGAGAIGIEFASFYRDLGCEVSVIEAQNHILPAEDEEISQRAQQALQARGINIYTASTIQSVSLTAEQLDIQLTDRQLQADRALVAVGVTGNIESLGLEAMGVTSSRGFIDTDAFGKTNLVGLYAIGDVTGAPLLAHRASHQAIACVEQIAGLNHVHPVSDEQIPGCTYCRPQIASVGLTERAALERGHRIRVGRFNLAANGKALAIGAGEGLVKTIYDQESGQLLGAHMIGPEVTEQIQGFCIAQQLEATEQELIATVFPHPTVSESIHESALDSLQRAIHQ